MAYGYLTLPPAAAVVVAAAADTAGKAQESLTLAGAA